MKIYNPEIRILKDYTEISANINEFRLWYRVPKQFKISNTGNPFLSAALIPAMLMNETLDIDPSLTISPKLFKNITTLQEIHNCWNPRLKKISINAMIHPERIKNKGSVSFFSGGVDSTYTFLKHLNDIQYVIFIHGFDFFHENETVYRTAIKRNKQFIESFEKTLIPISTNHYNFGYKYNLSRNLTQGSALASIALLLGFPIVYIPSFCSYDQLFPCGSHPLSDPLYSTEIVEIFHDGCEASRTDKLRKICEYQSALDNLTVCFNDMNVNCGKCAKCIRTMITLNIFGASSKRFPPLPASREIRKAKISGIIEMTYFEENLRLAMQSTNHQLVKDLLVCMRKNKIIKILKDFDKDFLGGKIKKTIAILRGNPIWNPRIDTTP